MIAMAEAGCDVIEVELPYSDPVMDGPVIQRASDIALAGGVRTRDTLRIIEAVAGHGRPGRADDLLEPRSRSTAWTRSPGTSPRPAPPA